MPVRSSHRRPLAALLVALSLAGIAGAARMDDPTAATREGLDVMAPVMCTAGALPSLSVLVRRLMDAPRATSSALDDLFESTLGALPQGADGDQVGDAEVDDFSAADFELLSF